MARENDMDFEDDVVYTSIYERGECLLFDKEADFLLFEEFPDVLCPDLPLDKLADLPLDKLADLPLDKLADLPLDKLPAAQLRQLVLAGRQREQLLQKECDELQKTLKIRAEVYEDQLATARRECEVCRDRVLKAADLSRLLKSSDPGKAKQKTLDLQNQKLEQHVRMEHNVRKLTGWRPL
jgi:hypothetical protein